MPSSTTSTIPRIATEVVLVPSEAFSTTGAAVVGGGVVGVGEGVSDGVGVGVGVGVRVGTGLNVGRGENVRTGVGDGVRVGVGVGVGVGEDVRVGLGVWQSGPTRGGGHGVGVSDGLGEVASGAGVPVGPPWAAAGAPRSTVSISPPATARPRRTPDSPPP
jgi:hypothetical protein